MSQDETFSVGEPLPKIEAVEPDLDLTVRVTWATGVSERIDLSPIILGYRTFKRLRHDRALFAQVHLDAYRSAIVWNDEMDLAAYTLEHLARAQRVMSPEDFREWMARHHLTLDAAAAALGVSRRTVAAISTGARAMDLTMSLACRGWDAAMRRAA
jgi:DNA-binding XRE family transcriptional regulator